MGSSAGHAVSIAWIAPVLLLAGLFPAQMRTAPSPPPQITLLPASTPPPSYEEAEVLFKKNWEERFPVPFLAMFDVPPGHRILFARYQGIPVYYYRFEVDLPRMFRDEQDRIITEKAPARRAEVWFRYQPRLQNVDFAFVREDLLPGTDKRWLE